MYGDWPGFRSDSFLLSEGSYTQGDNHLIELILAGYAQGIVSRNIKDLKSGELLFPANALMTPEELSQGDRP